MKRTRLSRLSKIPRKLPPGFWKQVFQEPGWDGWYKRVKLIASQSSEKLYLNGWYPQYPSLRQLDKFKAELKKVLEPMGFHQLDVSYDPRLHRVRVLVRHMNTPITYNRYVDEPRDYKAVPPETPIVPSFRIETIQPTVTSLGCQISCDRFLDQTVKDNIRWVTRMFMDQLTSLNLERLDDGPQAPSRIG